MQTVIWAYHSEHSPIRLLQYPPLSQHTDDLHMMLQLCGMALAFSPSTRSVGSCTATHTSTHTGCVARPRVAHTPAMGLFDGFKKAFANQEYDAGAAEARSATVTSARAAHILTATEAESQSVKEQIAKGELAFEEAAMQFSSCDSAARGGMLGKFGPGTMVKEFDAVVFGVGDSGDKPEYPCAEVIGPVRTKFGFHLIKIASRNMPKIGYTD